MTGITSEGTILARGTEEVTLRKLDKQGAQER